MPRKSGEPLNTPTRVSQLQLASLLDGEVIPDQVSELRSQEAEEATRILVEQVIERLTPVLEEIRSRLNETATAEQLQEVQAELAKLSQTTPRVEVKRSPWQRLLRPD
ncbi:MAG: hypothetical protein H7Y22_07145 [Gemmatimonadaceae bacterium]|nr:hypothetical protein [Gloeobacterales cyanobacterium ES-bin-141]